MIDLKKYVTAIPNFPKKGILFYDISPLLANPEAWNSTIARISTIVKEMKPDILVGLESRGFLVSAPVSIKLNMGFAMIRKKGRLPGEVVSQSYNLEYGEDTIEIKHGLIKKGQRVVILDDLLATGGTINASVGLMNKLGATAVGAVCILELLSLKGKANVQIPTFSLMSF